MIHNRPHRRLPAVLGATAILAAGLGLMASGGGGSSAAPAATTAKSTTTTTKPCTPLEEAVKTCRLSRLGLGDEGRSLTLDYGGRG